MLFPTLYKKAKTEATQQWTIEVLVDKYRTHAGQVGGVITTSDWTVCQPKNIGRANATSATEQAMNEAAAKWKKKTEQHYFEDITKIERNTAFFEPMLAEHYKDHKEKITFPVYSQPKLDGVRCIIKADGMWSRTGKRIVSCPHIFATLEFYLKQDPTLVFDGELYNHAYKDDFEKLASLIGKKKPTEAELAESAEKVEYWIYDIAGTRKKFSDRFVGAYQKYRAKMVRFVYTDQCRSQADLDWCYEKYLNDKFEGQMVRTNTLYENCRTVGLLKRKEHVDEEFKVLDVIEGEGNWSGFAATAVVDLGNGIVCKPTVKMKNEGKRRLWLNRGKVIGKQGTVRYQNRTKDGSLRFPRLIAIRDYE